MHFLYSVAMMLLAVALVYTLLEALRRRSAGGAFLGLFLAGLILQLLVSSFEAARIRATLAAWRLGPLEESLAFLSFAAFVLPLMVALDLETRKRIHLPRLLAFSLCFGLTLAVALAQPGFWLAPEPLPPVILAYAAFALSLGLYLWCLLAALLATIGQKSSRRGLLPLLILLLLRFIYETAINLGRPSLPGWLLELHAPLFALVLGGWIVGRQVLAQARVYLDARPVDPDRRAWEEVGLSPREREVAECICGGMSTADCADKLYISEKTVNSHLTNIYRKFEVKSRAQLLARLRQITRI